MSFIEFKNITKIYGTGDGEVVAVNNVSFSINRGEMVAIIGTSGSGKSTLLNLIGCLDKPTTGEYYIENKSTKNLKDTQLSRLRNKTFGFVVQYFALIDDSNVQSNIMIPLEYSKIKINKKDASDKIIALATKLNIHDKLKKHPKQLSGGQCQRVAIARALINNPDIILADEPTGALDKKTGAEVVKILRDLTTDGKSVVIVTHDNNIALQCDRILRIEDGIIVEERVCSWWKKY